ncbi:capsular biosynthesis protein [uncultured Sulfitobacter sp.]|uniref:capsule biosynthesis protein n=2 Tax=Sulfitobacter TaxID=60136 RepID=UPI0025D5D1F3|nr:capsular biosynthesis protein [uncultured Sulfitobacter sp.]
MVTEFKSEGVSQSKRSFVFLQGPTSPVMRDLGQALMARGHRVLKINLCPGDLLFWHGRDTLMYRGSLAQWPAFLAAHLRAQGATDIVYFADRFPYHRIAQDVARGMGVRPVSMEYGYLRPDWLILEEGGQSTYSHFPNSNQFIRDRAKAIAGFEMAQLHEIPEVTEAVLETGFHLSNAFLAWLLTPNYAPDRYYPVIREFSSYVPRLIRRAFAAKPANRLTNHLRGVDAPKFLVPLQMQNDYQLRDNAPPGYQHGFIREVMESFQNAAPANARLIFKLHPMDNGLENWGRRIPEMARSLGLADRVHFLDGGDLTALFGMVSGCVVINSTMGLRAIKENVPTKVMGVAVYDIDGLTYQGALDGFWENPVPPDPAFLEIFIRAIGKGIHVRGTVYGRSGRAAFVENAVARLEAPELHEAGLYVSPPPRLARARALGIDLSDSPDWKPAS